MTESKPEPTFAIGAVSRLTGIPADTLRVWGRRYDALAPRRTPDNRRCYTRADIERLTLIKRLVDQGHAVGSVANLGEEALRDRLRVQTRATDGFVSQSRKISVLVCGEVLPFLMRRWEAELNSAHIVRTCLTFADFEREALTMRPDVLAIESPTVQPELGVAISALSLRAAPRRTIVIYGFAANPVLERLHEQGILTLRGPLTRDQFEALCHVDSTPPERAEASPLPAWHETVPPARFDNETLAALTNSATKIRCECPHHLADLVLRLSAFERYSAECESRNDQDAALHARLHRTAAQARALLEDALARVIRCEGLPLRSVEDPDSATNTQTGDSS